MGRIEFEGWKDCNGGSKWRDCWKEPYYGMHWLPKLLFNDLGIYYVAAMIGLPLVWMIMMFLAFIYGRFEFSLYFWLTVLTIPLSVISWIVFGIVRTRYPHIIDELDAVVITRY